MAPHPQSEGGSSESGSVSSQHPYSRRALKSLARELQAIGDDAGPQEGGEERDHQAAVEPPAPPLLDQEGPPQPPEAPRGDLPLPLHDGEPVDGTDVSVGGQDQDAAEEHGAAAAEEPQPQPQPQLQPAATTVHDGEEGVQQDSPPGPAAELNMQQLQVSPFPGRVARSITGRTQLHVTVRGQERVATQESELAVMRDMMAQMARQLHEHNVVSMGALASGAPGMRTSDAASSDWYRSMPRTVQEGDNGTSSDPSSSAGGGGREGGGAGGGRGAVFWEDRYHHLLGMFTTACAADLHLNSRINKGPTAIIMIQAACRCFIQRHCYLACLRAAVEIETLLRGARLRFRFVRLRAAALKAQTAWRCSTARRCYLRLRVATVKAQTVQRALVCRSLFVQQRCAAIKLQNNVRDARARVHDRVKMLWRKQQQLTADLADTEAQLTAANTEIAGLKVLANQLVQLMSSDAKNQALLEAAKKGTLSAVKTLIDSGASTHVNDEYGYTPLHKAACNNSNVEVLRALLEAGADIHAKRKSGFTPLHKAAGSNSNVEVLRALLEAGADIHAKDKYGYTPLHEAAGFNSNVEVLRALLEAGADIHAKTDDGWTPLHKAAYSGRLAHVELLCARGADAAINDNGGKTALQLAQTQNHPTVVAFLQQRQQ